MVADLEISLAQDLVVVIVQEAVEAEAVAEAVHTVAVEAEVEAVHTVVAEAVAEAVHTVAAVAVVEAVHTVAAAVVEVVHTAVIVQIQMKEANDQGQMEGMIVQEQVEEVTVQELEAVMIDAMVVLQEKESFRI